MTTEDKARILMASERKKEEHLHENMLTRAEKEVETEDLSDTEEKARELIAQKRQHQEHLEENMLTRSSEEIQ